MIKTALISKLRKVLEVPCASGLRRNHNINKFHYARRNQNTVFTRLSAEQLGLRFCIWVAIKFETLGTDKPYILVSQVIQNKKWFPLYWEALELLKKNGVLITSDSVRALTRSYSYAGYTEEAVESFGRMREFGCEPDAHTYNTVLRGILRKELFVLALALYNTMVKSNCAPDEYTYNMLIDGFCKSENIKGAFEMLDEMQRRDIVPTVMSFTSIFHGLCQAKKVDEAHRLLNVMKEKGCPPDMISCNVLLDGFCKMGRLDEALSFVRLIERDGFSLQRNGYSSLIHTFFRNRRYNEAHAWYGRMCKEGILADVILYTIMIRGLSDEGRVGEAARMLDEMTRRGLTPDARCYNAIIKGFCDIGLLDQARSLYLQISKHDQFHNTCTHTILICEMCKRGMVKNAQEIFDKMEECGCVPSVVTFNALIHGLCKARNLKEANLLLYKMEIGRRPSFFFQISQGSDPVFDSVSLQNKVGQLCQDGQILAAYKFLIRLADSGVVADIITYNILINGFCKARNINVAIKLFEDMQIKGLSPDHVTYGTLIDGLYRVDREEGALKICENMLKRGCEPLDIGLNLTVCKSLMTWSCRKGKVSLAFSLYLDYLKNLPGRDNDSISALEGYFLEGKLEQAIRGLLELDFRARDFNLAPYTILLIGFCQAKKVNEALIIFSVLDEFNIKINATSCVHLIKALYKERKLDVAVHIFLYSLDKGFFLKPMICSQLLTRLLMSEDKKEHAVDIIDRMKSFGYCFEHRSYRWVLCLLSRYQEVHFFLDTSEAQANIDKEGRRKTAIVHISISCGDISHNMHWQSLVANEDFQHILRVLKTNVDGKQKIMFALTSIKGVGRRFGNIACKKADVDMNKRII